MGAGELLQATRLANRRRQETVAAEAGVSQSMVSTYELGRREPSWPTLKRLLRAAGAASEIRIVSLPPNPFTLADLADEMARAFDVRRRRLVLEFVARFFDAEWPARPSLVLEAPLPVGDRRWDALLAAVAEHLAFHEDFDPPMWTREPARFLSQAWFWVDLPSVRRRAVIGAPVAFRRRNVWVDRSDLERV